MAKQRIINTKFWSDSYVVNLNPLDRYLFLYLLTNEHTNICGIYELPLVTMANESGLEKEMLSKMIKRLKGKVFYIQGWVYLKNFQKHQSLNESVRKGIESAKSLIPKDIMEKITACDRLSEPAGGSGVFEFEFESNTKRIATKVADPLVTKNNDQDPLTCDEFVASCRKSPSKHVQVIAEWAEAEQPKHSTRGEWKAFLTRNLRAAKNLSPYEIPKIEKAYNLMRKDLIKTDDRGKKVGFLTKYSLETIGKYIDLV